MHCEHCFTESPNTSSRCIQCGKLFFEEKPKAKSTPKKSNGDFGVYFGIAGLTVGFYTGIFFLHMMLAYGLVFWLGKKFFNAKSIPYLTTIAIQASLIIVLGTYAFYGYAKGILVITIVFLILDIAIPLIGLAWFIKVPNLKPVIMLTVLMLITLVVNFINILPMEIGSQGHKALANYIVWRSAALFLLWSIFLKQKNIASNVDKEIS
jgi:hypothetical protein